MRCEYEVQCMFVCVESSNTLEPKILGKHLGFVKFHVNSFNFQYFWSTLSTVMTQNVLWTTVVFPPRFSISKCIKCFTRKLVSDHRKWRLHIMIMNRYQNIKFWIISCAFRWELIVIFQTDFAKNSVEFNIRPIVSWKTHSYIYLSSVKFWLT